jgi:16S rRNA processing protein RimM
MVMIGEIVRSHGVQGTVKIRATTDNAERFSLLKKVRLQRNSTTLGEYVIEQLRIANEEVYVKFGGVNDRDQAEQLRGAALMIPREECLPTAEDQFYHFDLIGLPAYTIAGEPLGEIVDIYAMPGNDVWVIRDLDRSGHETLIPAIKSVIKEVDLKNRRVVITPIPGLLDEQEFLA